MNAPVAPDLRPLDLGELLDRAVTLAVRAIVPLAVAYAVLALIGVATSVASAGFFEQLQALGTLGPASSPETAARLGRLFANTRVPALLGAFGLLAFLVDPLVYGTMVAVASTTYFGGAPRLGEAFATGGRRYAPMLALSLLWLVAAVVAVGIVAIAAALAIAAIALGLRHLSTGTLGIAITVTVALFIVAGIVAASVAAAVALYVSRFACVVEGLGPWRAFTSGVARTFSGIGFKRTLLAGAALLAVVLGLAVVSGAGNAVFAGLLHSVGLSAAFGVVMSTVSAIFVTAFATVFYYDLRVREDGLDLRLGAERAGGTAGLR